MDYAVWMPVQPKGSWLGEGDNHTFMNMLGNGLRAYEEGHYGGWGGRSISTGPSINMFANPADSTTEAMAERISNLNQEGNARQMAYPNFFPMAQNDFAARLAWSVTNVYADANHEPEISIEGPLEILANPGQKVKLHARVKDPDGDDLTIRWWQFEVGSYPGNVAINNPYGLNAEIIIPHDAHGGQTIHMVIEATDSGIPSLTRYQRVIITIRNQ